MEADEPDLIKSYKNFSSNRFTPVYPPPFLVYLYDSRKGFNIAKLHPMILGKRLANNNVEPLNIYNVGEDRIALIFPTGDAANKFVSDKDLIKSLDSEGFWETVIPDSTIYKIGVVHDIPLELTIDEVWNGICEEDKSNREN